MKKLYKLDSKNKLRTWEISVIDNGEYSTIQTVAGLDDGEKVVNIVNISSGKNIGKVNETSHYEQAISEAQAKWELKMRGEYTDDINNVTQAVLGSGIMAPMLAQKYHPTGLQKGSKTLEQMKIKGYFIHVQPKLDGNRCLIKLSCPKSDIQIRSEYGLVDLDIELTTAIMYTRKGDVMPVQLTHILDELINTYKTLYKMDCHHYEELVLDGELFSNEISFNELNGHLKRKESKNDDELLKIKFHLYDLMFHATYDKRYDFIKNFQSENVNLIPSYEITANDEAINKYLEKFISKGYEGLMIRTLNNVYENKRSWQLIKCKIFEDSEYQILDLEEDSMGRLGHFLMKAPYGLKDRDGKDIVTFKAGCTGITHEQGKEMLINKDKYIGKIATIEYFGLSSYGVPRFPKMKSIRND